MSGIDEVRTGLERLHAHAALPERCHESGRDGSLSHSTRSAANHKALHNRTCAVPFTASGQPATITMTLSAIRAMLWLTCPKISRNSRPLDDSGTMPLPTSLETMAA